MLTVTILGGMFALFVAVMAAGIAHMRHSIRVAERTIAAVTIGEVTALRNECVAVFASAFEETLDLENFEESARILSGRLDHVDSLKRAFAKEGFLWYFVLPVGAFLGELLRVHVNGTWRSSELGGLELVIPVGNESAQTFPFHKVIKHATLGDPGDVYAYLEASRQLDKLAERLDDESRSGD